MKRIMIGVMTVALAAAGAVGLNAASTSAAATTQSTQASVANVRGPGPGPGHADGTHAGGQVASVSGSTITVTGRDGASQSILTTATTTVTLDGSASSLAAIAAGQFLRAEGATDSAGTFTATAIDARTSPPQGHPGHDHP